MNTRTPTVMTFPPRGALYLGREQFSRREASRDRVGAGEGNAPAQSRLDGSRLLLFLGVVFVHVLFRVIVELVPAAAAADVIRLPHVPHRDRADAAADDALRHAVAAREL